MRINANIPSLLAFNAASRITRTTSTLLERLSTGLRINSASDDAAGLAISEKMTAQVRGLDQAGRNAQDGISLLRTAEGAAGEIHSIMQRMRELSVQAANDTLTAEDRDYIQLEIDQLTQQIDDIANQTQFNKKKILNGDAAVLWSTSTSDIDVIVGGTLLKKDAFGQIESAEGNYKITFDTISAGTENIQKSNIMYLKHGTREGSVAQPQESGLTDLTALNLVEGNYTLESRETPFGGISYHRGAAEATEARVGASLAASNTPNTVAPGEYDVRVSDVVPMMADFDAALAAGVVTGVNQSSRASTSDFDAEFTVTGNETVNASETTVYRTDIGGENSGSVGSGGDVEIETNEDNENNVFTHYAVTGTDRRDLMASDITVQESYLTADGAQMSVNLDYQTAASATDTATLTYRSAANESLAVETSYVVGTGTSFTVQQTEIQTTSDTSADFNGMTMDQIAAEINDTIATANGVASATVASVQGTAGNYYIRLTNNTGQTLNLGGAGLTNLGFTAASIDTLANGAAVNGTITVAVPDQNTAAGISGGMTASVTKNVVSNVTLNITAGTDMAGAAAALQAEANTKLGGALTFTTVTSKTGDGTADDTYSIRVQNTKANTSVIITAAGGSAADLGLSGAALAYNGVRNGTGRDYNKQTNVTNLGGLTINQIADRLQTVLGSTYGIGASASTSAIAAQAINITKAANNYSLTFLSDIDADSVETELGLGSGISFAANVSDAQSSAAVYNGLQATIDTGGNKSLTALATALEGLGGNTAAGFSVGTDNTGTLYRLDMQNDSMYDIVFTNGGTISELHGGTISLDARTGGSHQFTNRRVYVDHTATVAIGNMDMAQIRDELNSRVNNLLHADDGLIVNDGTEFFSLQPGAAGEVQLELDNAGTSGYQVTIDPDQAASELGINGTTNRGAAPVLGATQDYQKTTTTLDVDGKNIEETFDAINADAALAGKLEATWDVEPNDAGQNYGRLTLTNLTTGSGRRGYTIIQDGSLTGGPNANRTLFNANTTQTIKAADNDDSNTLNSADLQARDSLRVEVTWEGNKNNGDRVYGSGSATLWEGDTSATNLNALNAAVDTADGLGLGPDFFTNVVIADSGNTSDLETGDSWMLFTKAKVVGNADTIDVNLYDGEYATPGNRDGVTTGITYAFIDGALDNKTVGINEMVRTARGIDGLDTLTHNIEFGNDVSAGETFRYGERANAGTYMGNTEGVHAWYSHTNYGKDTTYFFRNADDPAEILKRATVNRQNDINASLLFIFDENGALTVRGKGFDRDGDIVLDDDVYTLSAAQMAAVAAGGPVTIHGIDFTNLHVDVARLVEGDKFVVNVAAAAKLDGLNTDPATAIDFQSTANIAVTGDPFQQHREDEWGSDAQYRLANGRENGKDLKLLGYFVSPTDGSNSVPGVGYYVGNLEMAVTGFAAGSTVGEPDGTEAGSARIHAEVNYQGSTEPVAGALVTSVWLSGMESDDTKIIRDFIGAIGYSNYRYGGRADPYGNPVNMTGKDQYNPYNASLIFDVVETDDGALTFRVQGHVIDLNGKQWYLEDEAFRLRTGSNTERDSTVIPPIIPNVVRDPVVLFQNSEFSGLYFDEFTLGKSENWAVGDRFTLSLVASGQGSPDIDELDLFSDNRGTGMPHSFRFYDGVLDHSSVDLGIYQLANNLAAQDSNNFYRDQVMDGTLSLSFGKYHPDGTDVIRETATFGVGYQRGMDAGKAHYYSRAEDIAQFYDANGRFILEGNAEMLTVRQDDEEIKIQMSTGAEIGNLAKHISEQIWLRLLKQPVDLFDWGGEAIPVPDGYDHFAMSKEDKFNIFQFVSKVPGESGKESVVGTFLAHSVLPGAENAMRFYGSEALMRAFAFNTIQEATETAFWVNVSEAHTGKTVSSGFELRAGETVRGVIGDGVGLDISSDIGLKRPKYNEKLGTFVSEMDEQFDQYVHLVDNAATLQIGANEGEDMTLTLGDMTAKALEVDDIDVRSRDGAARSITRLDRAIQKVSAQRAIIGAQINRLEHTISNLEVSSINLTASQSRIRDADLAHEMMEFTKMSILSQAASSMMAQANQSPNNILALLR